MKDKVLKFVEYINENVIPDKGEIDGVLKNLKNKIEKMFHSEEKKGDTVSKFGEENSLQQIGAQLNSIEVSKYTKLTHTLKLKYSCDTEDASYLYDYSFSINLEKLKKSTTGTPQTTAQAPEEGEEKEAEIKKCDVTIKKYDEDDFALLGQIEEKDVVIDKIDDKMIVELKNKIDEKTGTEGQGEEEFEIVLK